MVDSITKNRNGSPKFISHDWHGGRRWAHQWRWDIQHKRVARNRFASKMRWLREFGPSERWKPRGMPFMERHVVPLYGRLMNLRYWKW